jgi:hypothetical protein
MSFKKHGQRASIAATSAVHSRTSSKAQEAGYRRQIDRGSGAWQGVAKLQRPCASFQAQPWRRLGSDRRRGFKILKDAEFPRVAAQLLQHQHNLAIGISGCKAGRLASDRLSGDMAA